MAKPRHVKRESMRTSELKQNWTVCDLSREIQTHSVLAAVSRGVRVCVCAFVLCRRACVCSVCVCTVAITNSPHATDEANLVRFDS